MPVCVDFLVHLPLELVLGVLTYLNVRDTVRCRTVSRRWREILDQLDHYWRKACEIPQQFSHLPEHVIVQAQ